MIVFVNPHAAAGRGMKTWERVREEVQQRFGPFRTVILSDDPLELNATVASVLASGETDFVAAGGDGTVNILLQSVMRACPSGVVTGIRLGAVGLGSSNDFHKPCNRDSMIDSVPVKMDFAAAVRRDVGVVTLPDDDSNELPRYFLVNASIGITADANHYFNHATGWFRRLKSRHSEAAVLWAALRTIATFKPGKLTLVNGQGRPVERTVTNLGIVKNPHVSGRFRYDSPLRLDDGRLYVHLAGAISRPRMLQLLWNLARGKSEEKARLKSWPTFRLEIWSAEPLAIECDGEVFRAGHLVFSVRKQWIRVCP